jgi:hypothetical protein
MQNNPNLHQVTAKALQDLATNPALSEPCDLHSRPLNELQTARLAKATEKLMATLLPTLTTYYPVFASQFCQTDEQTHAVMAQYAKRMLEEGVDAAGFAKGIQLLERRAATERFAPNPSEFAVMCKPSLAELGIPEFQTVFLQIVERNGARAGEAFEFSHPIIRLISQRKGALIRELTGLEFERAIKAEYDHWVKRIASGETLPEPLLAIEQKPEMPDYLKGVKPAGKMAQRVEQLRQIANERKAAEQLASVHKA